MSLNGELHRDGQRITFLAPLTIAAAVAATATTPVVTLSGINTLAVEAIFLYGAGGTTVTAYVQTSLNGGANWFDVMCFAFTTLALSKIASVSSNILFAASAYAPLAPGDGTLTDNTCVQGILGDRVRLKYVTVGTYTGATSLAVYGVAKG